MVQHLDPHLHARTKPWLFRSSRLRLALVIAVFAMVPGTGNAELVMNGGFETSTQGGVGYISSGSTLGTWVSSNNSRIGVQRTDSGLGLPFANNGAVPEGAAVGFIQATTGDPTSTLSNTISGLVPGREYEIRYRVNARLVPGVPEPTAVLSVNGTPLVGANVNPVGGSNPYRTISRSFVATAASVPVSVTAGLATGTDATLLLDDFTVTEKVSPWSVNAWNDDATSGIDTIGNVYTHAYNFGNATSAVDTTINGQLFTGVIDGNPSVAGAFSLTGQPIATGDVNNITSGGSSALSDGFTFNGANALLTLEGLTAGVAYTTSLYTVGFDATGFRSATIGSGDDAFTVDVNELGIDNGLRLDYSFVADGTSREISLTPLQGGASTFHLYGFANATAVAVPEPSSALLLAGVGCVAFVRRRRVTSRLGKS